MSTCIVALTRPGAELAARVRDLLGASGEQDIIFYIPRRLAADYPGACAIDGPLGSLVTRIFQRGNKLVMIMALGIVVRLLAPHVRDKRLDPAVVVLDEGGNFVISVLSGHLGGANDLTRSLASALGASAVITTATDVHGLPAVDVLARDLDLAMEPFEAVRGVNSALVNGEKVTLYTEIKLPEGEMRGIEVLPWESFNPEGPFQGWVVLVTARRIPTVYPRTLFLRPRTLVAGLGCRRGIGREQVLAALDEAMAEGGFSLSSIRALATVDIKADEPGLREAAAQLGVPLLSFSRLDIQRVFDERGHELSYSKFVDDKIGVGGVCEPVTILAAPRARIVLPKRRYQGVTVAVAEE